VTDAQADRHARVQAGQAAPIEIALDRAVADHFAPDEAAWARAHDAERRSRTEQLKLTAEERRSLPAAAKALPEAQARALFEEQSRIGRPHRTAEAQADIAAARAAPTDQENWAEMMDANMAEVDKHQVHGAQVPDIDAAPVAHVYRCPKHGEFTGRQSVTDLAACPIQINRLGGRCGLSSPSAASLDAALSNAALADTPAVREMGGPVRRCGDPCPDCGVTLVGMAHVCVPGPAARPHHGDCAADINHTGVCTRADGTAILVRRYPALDPVNLPPGAVLLIGPEAERYRALQAAARAGQAAAAAVQTTSATLRDAFQAFCAGVAPGKEP
jgi:hypothetical protein